MDNLIKKIVYFILLATILSSCSTVKVTSDYDSKANFTEYKTFAFYKKGINSLKLSDIDKKRILSAVERELIRKGFTTSESPDVLVNLATNSEEYIEYSRRLESFSGWPSKTRKYTKGVISVELIDHDDKKLVWQGTASGVLNYINTKEATLNKEKQIKEFVTEIMAKYPPAAE